jgi:hypothetical protein
MATSDKTTIVVERQPDGKMRVTSGSWDGEKIFLRDLVLELSTLFPTPDSTSFRKTEAPAHDLHAAFQRLARERVKVVLMLLDFMFLNERKANRVVRPGRAAADGVRVSRECRRRWVDELRGGPA